MELCSQHRLYLSVIRVGDVTTRMHFLEVRYQFAGILRLVSRTTPKPLHDDGPRDHESDQNAHAQRELSQGIGRRKTHVARSHKRTVLPKGASLSLCSFLTNRPASRASIPIMVAGGLTKLVASDIDTRLIAALFNRLRFIGQRRYKRLKSKGLHCLPAI